MSLGALDQQVVVDGVEQEIANLLRAAARGDRPAVNAVVAARMAWSRLSRTDGGIPPWRLAELDAAMQELVRLVPLPSSPRRVRSDQSVSPADASEPATSPALQEQFDALRRRVDAVHDCIEAGRRPTRETFDALQDALVAHRRQADGAEIRQMIDDVRGFRRAVLATFRPATPSRLASSRSGQGFWDRPLVAGPARLTRRPSRPRRPGRVDRSVREVALSPERARLDTEARQLRDRAHRFAAAVPAGRRLPRRETDRLFLHFRILRPQLDAETQALNDAAVRHLVEAITKDRQHC